MNYGGPFSKIFAPPPEGCAKWSGVCESTAVYNTIDGSKCPMSPLTSSFLTHATPSCPEDRAIRKGPRPFGTAPPYIPVQTTTPMPEPKWTFLEEVLWGEGIPTWVWIAVGAGAALFLTRRRR
jgi:hypothetical protein